MITLYCTSECPGCHAIAEVLQELVLAHTVVIVRGPADLPTESAQPTSLPVLVDEGMIYQGSAEVLAHLEELEVFKERWDRFQSDACYCSKDEEDH